MNPAFPFGSNPAFQTSYNPWSFQMGGRQRPSFEDQLMSSRLAQENLSTQRGGLEMQRSGLEFGEFQAGAGLRDLERQLGTARSQIGLAEIGDVGQAGQRAYSLGREREEFERLKMATEGRRLQSQFSMQPQMEALRGGIMRRMAGSLGVGLPAADTAYTSRTGYTPSWMQNYQPPQFPRY